MCITFCNFRVQSAISSWSCSGVFFSVAFEEEIQVRDGVQARPLRLVIPDLDCHIGMWDTGMLMDVDERVDGVCGD